MLAAIEDSVVTANFLMSRIARQFLSSVRFWNIARMAQAFFSVRALSASVARLITSTSDSLIGFIGRNILSRLCFIASTLTATTRHWPQSSVANVRFGSLADILQCRSHVRFTPKSGHVRCN